MIIEQIDPAKVLISLCNEDMENFSLSFDSIGFSDPHSKKILTRLLSIACLKAGFEIKDKTMLVEALPHDLGCLILMTIEKDESPRKTYRIKSTQTSFCFIFDDSDAFFDCIEKIYSSSTTFIGCSAFRMDNKYYLVFKGGILPGTHKGILTEFGRQLRAGAILSAKLSEAGEVLAEKNAIEKIGRHFSG